MPGAFHQHLTEAIALNRARRPIYAAMTGGGSRRCSAWLIALEGLLLPAARLVDGRAARFNRVGLPVVQDDFVSMEKVRPSGMPPRYTGRMTSRERRQVARQLRAWRAQLCQCLWNDDLQAACRRTAAVLAALERFERRRQVHLAMSRHLLESAGYAALHGLGYARRSGGRTRGLTWTLVIGHALLAPLAVRLDHEAQRSHQRGVGLLVNDVPAIPFPGEMRSSQ